MPEISVVGLDLAKSIFQVHGVDTAGVVVACKRLRRSEMTAWFSALAPCLVGMEGLVGMEACATAHFWALRRGDHRGQRPCAPRQQAGHMTAPDHRSSTKRAMQNGGPHMRPLGRTGRRGWFFTR